MPSSDERAVGQAYWLRWVMETRGEIVAGLSKAGFGDILENEIPILATVYGRMNLQVTADVMSGAGVAERAIGEAVDRLARQGYLESRNVPDAPSRTILDVTKRGQAAGCVIKDTAEYRNWAEMPFRQGDIIISTVPKSGTTWMQMICALLIFQTPDLPEPLQEISPDIERWHMRDAVLARLASQQHRRFIKTHAGLGKMPANPLLTYVVVARHPLDTAVSFYHHIRLYKRFGPKGVVRPRGDGQVGLREALLDWMDPHGGHIGFPGGQTLPTVLEHVSAAWARRGDPNVVLVRYEDLSADLEGHMRLLAVRLGITVPEALWPRLAEAATFGQMRAAADRIQPLPGLADPQAFFRSGQPGAGREVLTSAELDRYHELAARLAPADLLDWLHGPGMPAAR
jgi:aryl sulfotransferase